MCPYGHDRTAAAVWVRKNPSNGYVEASEGSVAIAAADIPAACQGNASGDLPENVAEWVAAHGAELTAEAVELALESVDRVAGEESGLAESGMTPTNPNGANPLKTSRSGCARSCGNLAHPVSWSGFRACRPAPGILTPGLPCLGD